MSDNLKTGRLKVLVVDDDPEIHFLVREFLKERGDLFLVEAVSSLAASYEAIAKEAPDVVLLDLSLTTVQGLDSFHQFRAHAAHFPVVIFTSMDDEGAALEAVKNGAQDYIVKGQTTPRMLTQVLRYAVERFRSHDKAFNPDVSDPVTGLMNAHGFSVFAKQHLRSLNRNMNGTLVFLFVLDRLAEIEGKHGSAEAHRALRTTAEILKESFRASDLMARIGEDQFVVLPSTTGSFLSGTVMNRIKNSQTYYNTRFNLYQVILRSQVLHFPAEENLMVEHITEKIKQAFTQHIATPA
jgi:diguanylate cyclase (GGDEF)-like protein